jgi:hypothetical protein
LINGGETKFKLFKAALYFSQNYELLQRMYFLIKKDFVESPACGVGSTGPIVLGVGGVEQVLRPRPGDFHLGFGVDIVHHYLVGHRGALDNSAPKMPHQYVSYPPVSIIGKQEKFNFEDYFHNLLDE